MSGHYCCTLMKTLIDDGVVWNDGWIWYVKAVRKGKIIKMQFMRCMYCGRMVTELSYEKSEGEEGKINDV